MALVGLEMHWTPAELDALYLDDWDHHGLYWWESVINKQIENIKK